MLESALANISRSAMPPRRPWTRADLKVLRTLAGRKSVKAIGRALRRTEAAVRFKAHTKRIALAMK
jgi:hypothetical protein